MRVCPACHANLPDDPRWCACGRERPPRGWPTDDLVGRSVAGRYRIERRIGVGGMGVVYRATGRDGEPVAIKTLPSRLADAEDLARRFRREARVASLLRGPHVVEVRDAGELPDGTLYYAMELVDGTPLSRLLARGPLPVRSALLLLGQLADALAEAHGLGLVHRDLKPDNLLVVTGAGGLCLKVLDFGIVKVLDPALGTMGATQDGKIFGTPEYMSPEQARGAASVDHRTDIYSAGVCAFAMLTGRLPFEGETPQQAMLARMAHDAPLLSAVLGPDAVPPVVEAMVARMLARRPEDRYPDVATLRVDLAHVLGLAGPVVAPGAPAGEPAQAAVADTVALDTVAPDSMPLAGPWPTPPAGSTTVPERPAHRGRVSRMLLASLAFLGFMLGIAWLLAR